MQANRTLNYFHGSGYAGNNWFSIDPPLTCQNSETIFDDPSGTTQSIIEDMLFCTQFLFVPSRVWPEQVRFQRKSFISNEAIGQRWSSIENTFCFWKVHCACLKFLSEGTFFKNTSIATSTICTDIHEAEYILRIANGQ